MTEAGAFTAREFRDVLSRFVTGVTVVTAVGEDGPHGATVNSFTSLSLEPPMVLVCLRNSARSAELLGRSGAFAVNILSHEQAELGTWFASSSRPYGGLGFAGIPYRSGRTGSPLIEGAVGHIDCRVSAAVPAGDHTIFLGHVVDLGAGADQSPLAFHRGRFLPIAA